MFFKMEMLLFVSEAIIDPLKVLALSSELQLIHVEENSYYGRRMRKPCKLSLGFSFNDDWKVQFGILYSRVSSQGQLENVKIISSSSS